MLIKVARPSSTQESIALAGLPLGTVLLMRKCRGKDLGS